MTAEEVLETLEPRDRAIYILRGCVNVASGDEGRDGELIGAIADALLKWVPAAPETAAELGRLRAELKACEESYAATLTQARRVAAERDRLRAENAELLAALKDARPWLEGTPIVAGHPPWIEAVEKVRAAIAKAKGRS